MALLGTYANLIGRKPLLLIALAALPLRGLLYGVSNSAVLMLGVAALDGLAGGLLEVLVPLILADIMSGTGRYNLARGFLGTVQGIGGWLSQAVAGLLVVRTGYETTFFTLGGIATAALVLVLFVFPETQPQDDIRKAPAGGPPR